MKKMDQGVFTGERALFKASDLEITNSIFEDGESPLKESKQIKLNNSIFKWKYPIWYSNNIEVNNSTLLETARSGIWYTNHITMNNCTIAAPKTFRRSSFITLNDCTIPNADETFWNCKNLSLTNVSAKGNYFGFNSESIKIDRLNLYGNYSFDGSKNIEIRNSILISKDAFWNCKNVCVYDSKIIGEYLGWNSKNIKFYNCVIESHQGMCYMENLELHDCEVINTDLAFEFSTVYATVNTMIDSVKNPYGGSISAKEIKELILDEDLIDKSKISIKTER